jgi:2,4-dienoyl-CoA reductase-like NADH-dependent reductase (Old Yellow Enzyme family)
MEFKRLFTPITIQGMELRNRIVLLPMSTGFIELDESGGNHFINFYVRRAKGGAGLLIIPFTPMKDSMHVESDHLGVFS